MRDNSWRACLVSEVLANTRRMDVLEDNKKMSSRSVLCGPAEVKVNEL